MGDAEASPAASAGDGPPTLAQRSGPCSALIADEGAGFAIYAAERGHRAAHNDGREIRLRRITEPTAEQKSLLRRLGLSPPERFEISLKM